MRNLFLFLVFTFFVGLLNAQQLLVPGGAVGNSGGSTVQLNNAGYTGFFIKETSGTGSAQFRFRANVGSFIFDDASNVQHARIEFNGSSDQLNFFNDVNGNILFRTNSQSLYFTNQGRLGVGTLTPQSRLAVNGKMECEEVQVKQDVADYVFTENHKLLSLGELETYIDEHGHLPRIQTQEDVDNNRGLVKLGDLTVSLMEKVEELTLHLIEMDKRVKSLEKENEALKKAK